MSTDSKSSILDIHDGRKEYGATRALDSASLTLWPGEVHALMGENGAGKSTLIKVLAGVIPLDSGSIRIDSQPALIRSPRESAAYGLRFIHQELNVIRALSVAENIFTGARYPTRLGVFVDWRKLHTAASRALAALGVTHIRPDTPMGRLSIGDQMLVRIAAALLDEARIYIMDEPTAALTAAESDRLFTAIRTLRERGAAILYVSHRLGEVFELSDRVTVLRDGKTVAAVPIRETTPDQLIQWMTGRTIVQSYPARTLPLGESTLLQVRNLRTHRVRGVSFQLQAGEIIGLAGLSGAGRSEVLQALIGADQRSGAILLRGKPLVHRSPSGAWRSGLAYVPEERRAQGVILTHTIRDNVTFPHLAYVSRIGTWWRRGYAEIVSSGVGEQVRLRARHVRQTVHQLSGGNQQKVVFGRALAGDPSILLLDEPTRGVDVGAKTDIYEVIRAFAARGNGVIIASSDLPELIGLCDRLLILQGGAIRHEVTTHGLTEGELLAQFYRVDSQ